MLRNLLISTRRMATLARPALPALSSRAAILPSDNAVKSPVPISARRHYSVTNPSRSIGGPDFDPNAVTAMDKQTPPAPGSDFNVVIVGAGNINFGSDEGPWNHSFRLEQ